MIRATAGTWCSYATTFAFQILFAKVYGAGPQASAFVLVFGMAIAVGAIFNSTAQALAVPRLAGRDGAVSSGALRFLVMLVALGAVPCVAIAAASGPISSRLGSTLGMEPSLLRELIPPAIAFGFLQLVYGALSSIALACGRRFTPAVLPVMPTLFGAGWLILATNPNPRSTMVVLAIASVVQVVLMAATLPRPLRISTEPLQGIAKLTLMTGGHLVLLSFLPWMERVVAALDTPNAAAQFDYAIRSLLAIQQLLMGGLAMSSLPDWADSLKVGRFGSLLTSRLVLSALLLALAASIGLVGAPLLVRTVYQHGEFSSTDTEAVAKLLRIGLPGFFAGALGMLMSRALLAARLNGEAIAIGVARFFLTGILVVFLGSLWGVYGVAAGVSVAEAVIAMVALKLALDIAPPSVTDRGLMYKATSLVGLTAAAALLTLALPSGAPQIALATATALALLVPYALLMRASLKPAVWVEEPRHSRAAWVGSSGGAS